MLFQHVFGIEALAKSTFKVERESVVGGFDVPPQCKTFTKSLKACIPAECTLTRLIDSQSITSRYQVVGPRNNKCHVLIEHSASAESSKGTEPYKCNFNKLQLNRLSRSLSVTLSGKPLKIEYGSCLTQKQDGLYKMTGSCRIRIDGNTFYDVQKMAIFWKQCQR